MFGYHYILDCSNCTGINDELNIRAFCKELIDNINMIAVGNLQIEYLLEGCDNEGYSLLQLIVTSNITAHFVTKTGAGYIDVFSCKKFNRSIVDKTVKKYFNPKKIKKTFLKRSAD